MFNFTDYFCNKAQYLFFMSFINFLKSKVFIKHLIIWLVSVVTLFLIISFWLKSYTKHGEYISVPDFTGLLYDEVDAYASQRDLIPVIIDSIYDNTRVKGSVVGQAPPPEQLVKKNRKIYLTIVALSAEMVRMPDLTDLTLRQAISTLDIYDLKIGRLRYTPHIAVNAVLAQEYRGREIEPGAMIEKGSTINLVLGQGLRNERTTVPFLLGKSREEAIRLIQTSSLNIGAEFFEDGANESRAYVARQRPLYSKEATVHYGSPVDLWYKPRPEQDLEMLQKSLEEQETLFYDEEEADDFSETDDEL